MKIQLSKIRLDGGTQPRAALNEDWTLELVESLNAGAILPPVTVFHDGKDYWLADGFHRVKAHVFRGAADIEADVRQGMRRDAVLFSVGANAGHGQRRTPEDKRRAVLTLLNDSEWSTWPQGNIAKACGVSREYVCRLQKEIGSSCDRSQDTERKVERGGQTFTQNTANIGKTKPASNVQPIRPPEPPDEWKCKDCGLMWGFDVEECLDCNPPETKTSNAPLQVSKPEPKPTFQSTIASVKDEAQKDPCVRMWNTISTLTKDLYPLSEFELQRASKSVTTDDRRAMIHSLSLVRAWIDQVLEAVGVAEDR